MQYISATEVHAEFVEILARVQKEPIVIQRQNKDIAVLISPGEYEKLRRLRLQELDEICIRASAHARNMGLTDAKLAELLADES